MAFPNPFLNAQRRLRNGWWIAIFMAVLTVLLAPLIVINQANEGVPIWQQAAAVFCASAIAQALRRRPMAELFGVLDGKWLRHLGLGCAIGAALMAAPAMVLSMFGLVTWEASPQGFAALTPALALFTLVAVTEEVMFRGFVFQRLIDGLGAWLAQVIVSGFFVLVHLDGLQSAGALAPMAGLNIFLASIMFGLAFLRTKSLALPIGVHFAANFVQGGVLGFGVSGSDEHGMLTPKLAPGVDWLTGGGFGLEGSLPGLICVTAIVVVLLIWRSPA